jgi:hypothetical protein
VKCSARKKGSETNLSVGPSSKTFIAKFNKATRPGQVTLNGKDIPHLASLQAFEKAGLGWHFDAATVVYARFGASGSETEVVVRS